MNQKKMSPSINVVILVDRYDSLGGIQRWANQIASELQAREFKVHLIGLSESPSNKSINYHRDERIHTVTLLSSASHQAYRGLAGKIRYVVATLPTPVRNKIDHMIMGWRPRNLNESAVKKLQAEITSLDGGTILIATSQILLDYLNATDLHVGKNTDMPLIAQYHNDFQLVADKNRAVKQFRKSYTNADRVVFLTDSNKSLAIKLGIENVEVVPNPRPTVLPDSCALEKKKVAIALGRLDRQKSFDYLLYAWREVKNEFPDWQLHIYGTGPEEKRLRGLIKKLGLSEFASLRGVTDEPLKVLGEASIHLISSQHEGWALTISEAAAVKTPTISFESGPGIRAQITSGENGILVKKNDIKSYSLAIKSLLSDPRLLESLGENALNDSARYSIDNVVEKWVKLFQDVTR